jgi:hypothetical protein
MHDTGAGATFTKVPEYHKANQNPQNISSEPEKQCTGEMRIEKSKQKARANKITGTSGAGNGKLLYNVDPYVRVHHMES